MNWPTIVATLAVVAFVYLLKRRGQISPKDALVHLRNGALVIDVRSPAEFRAGHLPNTINFPVDEIEIALPLRMKDKNQLLLLHCQSGMRSGVAVTKLKSMDYANAFNLGSYRRAAGVVNSA